MIEIELSNQQSTHPIDDRRLVAAVRLVLEQEGIRRGVISIAVVDDPTMQDLNRRYLQHDYPTDVLSFLLEQRPGSVEGEVVVSADTAADRCHSYGWSPDDELLLYVIHGALHLAGYDDGDADQRAAMRRREEHFLSRFGLVPHDDQADQPAGGEEDP
jgi:probable rRNA maturation factor